MYHKILLALLFLIVIYLLYQNYNIQREIYKIKNSFEELNNFLDLSIKKTKPKVLDTLSSINTTDITDNIVTYSNDVKRVKPEATINSEEQQINEEKIDQDNQDNQESESEKKQEFEIVHLQDSSDSEMGSFNLKVFNNIKNSIVNQLNTSSSNEEENKENNLVVLSTEKSETINSVQSPKKESPKKESPKPESPKKESPKPESPKKESPVGLSESPEKITVPSTKTRTSEELNKLTIVNIKEIAKELNIVLSINGKLKNKASLISDILRVQ